MKFALTSDVKSSIQLPHEVTIRLGETEYSFIPDGTNTLHKIKVTADVSRPEQFTFGSRPQSSLAPPAIVVGYDGQLYQALIHELQDLESLLAFSCNLNKIYWEHPREERIAERPEERGFGFHVSPNVQEEVRIPISEADLTSLLNNKESLSPLTVAKSFWREARNAYTVSRYITAFVNAFFVLEGLYANGQFSKKGICDEFLSYAPFVDSVNQLFAIVRAECPEHLTKISQDLAARGKTLSVEEFAMLLVETRAELSHFILRDLKKRERLFEENYWTISFLCIRLATILIEHESDLLVQQHKDRRT